VNSNTNNNVQFSILNVPTLSVGMLTFCKTKSSALNIQYADSIARRADILRNKIVIILNFTVITSEAK
jgi:hypothetical protein